MEPESKIQESSLEVVAPVDKNACTPQYPACASLKRTSVNIKIDPAIKESFRTDFDILPLVEEKMHDYKYIKHYSLETNQLLKCRWAEYKKCLKITRVPRTFPSAELVLKYPNK